MCNTVGEDGRFTIEGVPAGRWDVVASAKGFVPARAEPFVELDPLTGHAPVEIRIARGGVAVEGSVEDPLGRPVAHARVRAYATTQSELSFPDVDTETDTEGRFSLWLPEGSVGLEASATGYASTDAVFAAPTRKAKLAVRWEAIVTGRVVDGSGAGVPGARVVAEGPEEHTVRAAADGSFSFTGLSGGRWKFEASAPGLRGTLASVLVDPGNRTDGVVVVASSAARVEASIVSDNGAPCEDGSLRLHDPSTETTLYASTDVKGFVHFDAVLPGTWEVEVECSGKDASGERPKLAIAGADVVGLVYGVREGIAARGVLVDDKGSPIAEASVFAEIDGKSSRYVNATTKSDGTFVLGGLSNGTWRVEANDNRFLDVQTKVEIVGSDVSGLRLVASRGAILRGKVIDGSGVGIPNVEVQVEGSSFHNAVTRDDGTFRIAGLSAGDHVAWVTKDGGRLTFLVPTQKGDEGEGIAFTAPEKGELALDLRVAPPNLVITGKVVDASGAPVVEASVYWRREWHDEEGAAEGSDVVLTDVDGKFRITGLAPGNYSIRARKKGAGEMLKSHVPAGGIALVTLQELGSVTAVLGTKIKHGRVRLEDSKRSLFFHETIVGTDRVLFDDVPAGEYELSVSCEEGTGYQKVALAVHDAKTVSLELSAWASITGSFAHPEARVSMYCEGCARASSASVDLVGGVFRADHLAPGTYRVDVFDKRMLARGKVVAVAGEVATVILEPIPEVPDPVAPDPVAEPIATDDAGAPTEGTPATPEIEEPEEEEG
ncbi:MAG: carboxypeptidase regulatory-like domain-containing protein [Polyangiales bacterium]